MVISFNQAIFIQWMIPRQTQVVLVAMLQRRIIPPVVSFGTLPATAIVLMPIVFRLLLAVRPMVQAIPLISIMS